MTKISKTEFLGLIDIIKKYKDEIFISQENIDKKRHELIDAYKDTPELLMKLLHETIKPYKNIKDVKKLLKLKGVEIKVKDTILKFIIENIEI